MDLGELEQQVRAVSTDPAVQGLADQLAAWKDGPTTADELVAAVERYIGNTWIGSSQDHERVYALWSAFRESAMAGPNNSFKPKPLRGSA